MKICYYGRALFLLLLGVCLLVTSRPGETARFVGGDLYIVEPGTVLHDDLYFTGDTLEINGEVQGDILFLGRVLKVNGPVNGSIMAAGESLTLDARVEHTARLAGNNIHVNPGAYLGRDLFTAGNNVVVGGQVERDFVAAGNIVRLDGQVGRDVQGTCSNLEVNGTVGKDVSAQVERLIFGPQSVVGGDVRYTSSRDAVISPGSSLLGTVQRVEAPPAVVSRDPGQTLWGRLRPLLSLVMITLLLAYLLPGVSLGTARVISHYPWKSLSYGSLAVFVTPAAALILLFTVIGIPLSFLLMLVYGVLLYMSRIFTGFFLGQFVAEQLRKDLHPALLGVTGIVVLTLLTNVPYVGWLIHVAAVLFAAGGLIYYLWESSRERGEQGGTGGQLPPEETVLPDTVS